MNFGKWILVSFVAFALFIGVLVTVCMRQDISMVSKQYYKDELNYGAKFAQRTNTGALEHPPVIAIGNGTLIVLFTDSVPVESGKLTLSRPSNEKLDEQFQLEPSTARQEFELKRWQPGLYRASLTWTMAGKDYFLERLIVL